MRTREMAWDDEPCSWENMKTEETPAMDELVLGEHEHNIWCVATGCPRLVIDESYGRALVEDRDVVSLDDMNEEMIAVFGDDKMKVVVGK